MKKFLIILALLIASCGPRPQEKPLTAAEQAAADEQAENDAAAFMISVIAATMN